MNTFSKLDAVRKLANIAVEYPEVDSDFFALIEKIVSPPTPIPASSPSTRQPISPTLDELYVARAAGKLAAIKVYRTRTGLDLKEAKENIEKAMEGIGWEFVHGSERHGYPPFLFELVYDPCR